MGNSQTSNQISILGDLKTPFPSLADYQLTPRHQLTPTYHIIPNPQLKANNNQSVTTCNCWIRARFCSSGSASHDATAAYTRPIGAVGGEK